MNILNRSVPILAGLLVNACSSPLEDLSNLESPAPSPVVSRLRNLNTEAKQLASFDSLSSLEKEKVIEAIGRRQGREVVPELTARLTQYFEDPSHTLPTVRVSFLSRRDASESQLATFTSGARLISEGLGLSLNYCPPKILSEQYAFEESWINGVAEAWRNSKELKGAGVKVFNEIQWRDVPGPAPGVPFTTTCRITGIDIDIGTPGN